MRLSGDFGQYIFDEFCNAMWPQWIGGEKFRLAYEEEAKELGYGDDPGVLVVRRESDGACFEVELEATIRPIPTAEERAENAKKAERLREYLAKQESGTP